MSNKYDGDDRREPIREPWHLNRGVPISLIFAILIQTAGMFWYGGGLDHRVKTLETKSEVTVTKEEASDKHEFLQLQITNNDETDEEIKKWFEKIDDKLDRLIEQKK